MQQFAVDVRVGYIKKKESEMKMKKKEKENSTAPVRKDKNVCVYEGNMKM